MEVSTFELLVKRIAPPPADPAVARRVVQGYFLTMSNLEDKEFLYTLDFQYQPSHPARCRSQPWQAIGIVLLDIAGANQVLTLAPSTATVKHDSVFPQVFGWGAKQTASLQLLPNINNPALLTNPNPDLEVRGFVQLRLPAVFGSPQRLIPSIPAGSPERSPG